MLLVRKAYDAVYQLRPGRSFRTSPGMPTAAPAGFSFRKGSIAKIEVWNFVTYDHSAIYPNDSLNLIVGPNGSGKSSIVCAMCLGFGGSPKLLQRGETAKDYVQVTSALALALPRRLNPRHNAQHDKDEAVIEISLSTGNGNEVVVLRRVIKITRDDYGSPDSEDNSWFIDNRKCPVKEVKAVVTSYNIQLSNYTQFLPQDVVKEFPALTAEQLLRKTEEALGTHQSQPSKFTAPAHRGAWYCALLTSSSLCTLRRYFAFCQAREADRAARNGQRRPHAV